VAQNQATKVSGVSLTESGNTSGETFTVVVSDGFGVLGTMGGAGSIVSSKAGETLTITGTVAQVNTDLGALTDDDAATAPDTITINASDDFGNSAAAQSIAVTVTPASGALSIAAPATATVGVGRVNPIAGISVSESPPTTGETFTAILTNGHGVLSATASGGGDTVVQSNAGKTLTIEGTLAQVDADLATLTDTDRTFPSDTITVNASDSFGNVATQTTTVITVNGLPVITAPSKATVAQNQATPVSGVSLAESGTTSGEPFTVVLSDCAGVLGTTGGAGSIVSSKAGETLTITGTLAGEHRPGRVD
jgi:hypothetical protein